MPRKAMAHKKQVSIVRTIADVRRYCGSERVRNQDDFWANEDSVNIYFHKAESTNQSHGNKMRIQSQSYHDRKKKILSVSLLLLH